jgi:DNA ligase (NAD+)
LEVGEIMNLESKNLLTELLEADSKYYSTGTSPLSDAQYDMKRAQFKKLEPNHSYNQTIGAPIPVDAKPVKHRIVAGSLEKLQDPTEISAWGSKKGRSGYRMDWKLDGYTLVLQYEDGVLKEAATRGDGVIGESVLWNAALMESVPKRLPVPFTGDVRGECVLNKVIFERVFKPLGYSNARNAVAVIRDQKGNGLAKYLSFVAFDLVTLGDEVFNSENEKRSFMAQMGFTVVPSILIDFNVRNIFETFDTFQANRIEYCYEVDGVVVRYESLAEQAEVGSTSDLRPKGQRCIKFANEEAKTVCTGYTLTLGSSGSIIPTLSFEPVEIGGAMVSSVLGCNFTLLKEKDIAIGDHVTLTRAGGVIPYIQRVDQRPTNRVLINPPKFCPICGYTTVWEGAHLKCGNEECEGKAFRLLQLWVQKREIKGLGETLLQTLYDEYEVMTPVDLYSLNYATLSQVMMSGRKVGTSASTILAEIEKSKECSLQDLVGSVGVKLLGRQEAENIMNRLGVTTLKGSLLLRCLIYFPWKVTRKPRPRPLFRG